MNLNLAQLVEKAKKRDGMAMHTLYQNSVQTMFSISYRLTNHYEDSKDIVQEAYIMAFDKIGQLANPNNFFGWLKRIVINESLRVCKKHHYYKSTEQLVVLEDESDEEHEDFPTEKLHEAIQELPNGCRAVFTLFLLEDYKHREIAEMLGISLPTSKSQYQYALKLLRKKLSKYRK